MKDSLGYVLRLILEERTMSKIGNYVLGRIEDNDNIRYRNNYGYGSHMVLWLAHNRREKNKRNEESKAGNGQVFKGSDLRWA